MKSSIIVDNDYIGTEISNLLKQDILEEEHNILRIAS